jgi:predicted nucleic acid-binding protein
MIVVADTSPINYLILIGQIDVLPKLFGAVVIPYAVREELLRGPAPESVRSWALHPPEWLEIRTPAHPAETSLASLDAGERDAIAIAEELLADVLVVDDRAARRVAQSRGLAVIGILGVLHEAADRGLLELRGAIKALQRTSFYITPNVLKPLLEDED